MEDPKYPTPAAPISPASGAADEAGTSELKASGAILAMEGGDGEYSYARNSRVQSQAVDYLKPILMEEIGQLNLPHGGPVQVADLGCSVGANTLSYADILCQCVRENFQARALNIPEIQYYFSDLPSNDFNTLFQQLQEHELMNDSGSQGEPAGNLGKKCYAAAVPGSFFGRLFPVGHLHVVISTFAIQWLSEIPAAVKDKTSPAYNKGRAWIEEGNPAVLQAYAQTSKRDLQMFFQSRALEVASGGLLVLCFCGRADHRHPEQQWINELKYAGPYSRVFEETWKELVVEGFIDEETLDSFNVPVFAPSLDEVREAVQSTKAFHIKRLLIRELPYFSEAEEKQLLQDPEAYGQFAQGFTRALIASYIEAHIGKKCTEEFFERYARHAAMAAREKKIPRLVLNCQFVILVRK